MPLGSLDRITTVSLLCGGFDAFNDSTISQGCNKISVYGYEVEDFLLSNNQFPTFFLGQR